jgi:hypothetical protein
MLSICVYTTLHSVSAMTVFVGSIEALQDAGFERLVRHSKEASGSWLRRLPDRISSSAGGQHRCAWWSWLASNACMTHCKGMSCLAE